MEIEADVRMIPGSYYTFTILKRAGNKIVYRQRLIRMSGDEQQEPERLEYDPGRLGCLLDRMREEYRVYTVIPNERQRHRPRRVFYED